MLRMLDDFFCQFTYVKCREMEVIKVLKEKAKENLVKAICTFVLQGQNGTVCHKMSRTFALLLTHMMIELT